MGGWGRHAAGRGLALLVLITTLPACSSDDADVAVDGCALADTDLVEPGHLSVATGDPVVDPARVGPDGDDVPQLERAVVEALAAWLDVGEVRWEPRTFEEVVSPALAGVDLAVQRIEVTEERALTLSLSAPYYRPPDAVVGLPTGAAAGVRTRDDLRELTWGVVEASPEADRLVGLVAEEAVTTHLHRGEVFAALLAGDVDATLLPLPTARDVVNDALPEAEVVGAVLPPGDLPGQAMVVPAGGAVLACVDAWVAAATEDGTLRSLVDQHEIADLTVIAR